MKLVKSRVALVAAAICLVASSSFAQKSLPADERYRPTDVPLRLWGDDQVPMAFDQYLEVARSAIARSRWRIEGESDAQRAERVRLTAPAEWPASAGRQTKCLPDSTEGVLLIHGLTDSPFLMRDLGDYFATRPGCFVIRSILLPGHGTAPGDLGRATYEDWAASVRFGINSFRSVARRVHLVGFSTGGALSIYWAYKQAELDVPIASLMLFSPAIRPTGFFLRLKVLPHLLGGVVHGTRLEWSDLHADQDFAKYESFSFAAGYQIYRLDEEIERLAHEPVTMPVFMALSRSDSTINAVDSINFFLRKTGPNSRMMLIAPTDKDADVARALRDVRVQYFPAAIEKEGVVDFAHTAFTVRPDNSHYGRHGDYANCTHYDNDKDRAKYCACITPLMLQKSCGTTASKERVVYGENDKESIRKYTLRRLTFNPYFSEMTMRLDSFLAGVR